VGKRLRIFAGPNGSGKSTLVKHITEGYAINYGHFINADEIEKHIKDYAYFDFSKFDVPLNHNEFLNFVKNSTYNTKTDTFSLFNKAIFDVDRIIFENKEINSYHAALIAEYLRKKLLESNQTFTFETVMSDVRKLGFIKEAKSLDYRIYFYFVATEDYRINVERVLSRVSAGGHSVPEENIKNRYFRTMNLLLDAIRLSDRAFLFDNSADLTWIAEVNDGKSVTLKSDFVPQWFIEYIEEKLVQE
jgi:predicted ABC-type ATPase